MNLIKYRNVMKAKKPEFIRQDAHKVKRLDRKWRKPKGLHSKMRHKFKGYRSLVSKGYKSPSEVRGLSKRGMQMILVSNLKDILKIDGTSQVAIIAKSIGMRKRSLIVEKANERNITIINIKDQKNFKKNFEERVMMKKEEKMKISGEDVKKEGKTEKSLADKVSEKKESVKSKEDNGNLQKREFDKVLTKPEK